MLLFALTACDKVKFWEDKHSAEAAMHTYTCPMHPEVISDKPGKCPKCGMDLVLKDAPEKKEEGIKLDDLLKPTNEFVISELPVVKLKKENPDHGRCFRDGRIRYSTDWQYFLTRCGPYRETLCAV